MVDSPLSAPPNTRVQRTRVARCARPGSPLTRHPLGGRIWRTAIAVVLVAAASGACHEAPTEPTPTAVFRMRSLGETFWIGTSDPETIREAERLIATGEPRDAVGTPRAGNGGFNGHWHWHIHPGSLRFQANSPEQCQTNPRGVEDNLDFWLEYGMVCVGGSIEARER
jgi:hypothetical protein